MQHRNSVNMNPLMKISAKFGISVPKNLRNGTSKCLASHFDIFDISTTVENLTSHKTTKK